MPSAQETADSVLSSCRTRLLPLLAALVVAMAPGCGVSHTGGSGAEGRVNGTLHLETFVLNLGDLEQRSYLRVGIDLGLSHEIARGENAPVGEVRDTILGVLAQSRVDDLLTAKGKLKLKDDLLHALQERIPRLGVEEVYFTEFLIQR